MPRQRSNARRNATSPGETPSQPDAPAASPPLPDGVTFERLTIDQLVPDDRNANRGTPRGMGLLENSLQRNKLGRSVLIDRERRLIAGNKTAETFGAVGGREVLVVKTRGDVLIAHEREDLDLHRDVSARELAIADNRVAEANLDWDAQVLAELQGEGVDLEAAGINDEELERLLKEQADDGAADPGEPEGVTPPPEQYLVIVECRSESEQVELLQRLTDEGLNVKAQNV